jgi:hypothetical protein
MDSFTAGGENRPGTAKIGQAQGLPESRILRGPTFFH